MIEEIQEHFEKEYPREGCGIIGIVKGKKRWFPCENVADNEDDFVLSSTDYFEIVKKCDIFAIVHSHPDSSNKPSTTDINYCNALGIPYWIFSYPDMELNILQPKEVTNPLIGREYVFGKADCFEAARDWLASKDIHIPRREPFEDDWWNRGLNYFSEERMNEWNFKKVDSPENNDILLFQVIADVPDHCGVYIGNNIFFHHANNRLSCREPLSSAWLKYLVGVYRYDA